MENGKTVLVVDDEPSVLKLTSIYLKEAGYQVSCAENGKVCLDMLASGLVPALILLDIMMPGMSGYEVSGIIRQYPAHNGVKILFFTAMSRELIEGKYRDYGADGYIIKGDPLEDFYRIIKEHIGAK